MPHSHTHTQTHANAVGWHADRRAFVWYNAPAVVAIAIAVRLWLLLLLRFICLKHNRAHQVPRHWFNLQWHSVFVVRIKRFSHLLYATICLPNGDLSSAFKEVLFAHYIICDILNCF